MTRVILRRVGHLVPVLLIVSLATMLLLDLMPGDPAYAILGDQATPEQVAAVRHDLGLDRSLPVRYVSWLGDIVTGDFGESYRTGQPVLDAVRDRLPVTLQLAVMALVMSLLVAVPLGVYTAYRASGLVDRGSNVVASLLISSPAFLTALVVSYLFAVRWNVFPVTGWTKLSEDLGANLRGAFLPSVTLALAEIPVLTRLLRNDMIATLQEDFILSARAKGMPTRVILLRHALRPSSFSLLTLGAISLGRLLGGTVIVETVFALPGLGQLVIQSILRTDFLMVQGVTLLIALAYVLINAVVDVCYVYLDPRVRLEGGRR